MDQITNVNSVSFKANQPVKEQTEQEKPVNQVQVENGDEKSMDALKWAGIIGAGALAAAAVTTSVIKGKGINSKYVDMQKLAKTGIAELNDEGKKAFENKKILKFIQGIGKDGSIKKAKIVSDDVSKLQTFVKNGKRFSQKATVDGKKVKLWYDSNNKLTKTVKGGVKTTFEYGTEGATKGKLIKKTVGKDVFAYKYDKAGISEIVKNDKEVTKFTRLGKKLEKIEYSDGAVQKFSYDHKGNFNQRNIFDKDGNCVLHQYIKRNDKGIELFYKQQVIGDSTIKETHKNGMRAMSVKSKNPEAAQMFLFGYGDKDLKMLGNSKQGFTFELNKQPVDCTLSDRAKLLGVNQDLFDTVGKMVC
ncbi:MAG: hypothetical protein IJW73_02030 [Candidatus Gastranaerophilales bacterium]|nr:hypothetical protein [Candidatus Gastranaerophilales bacterium]